MLRGGPGSGQGRVQQQALWGKYTTIFGVYKWNKIPYLADNDVIFGST